MKLVTATANADKVAEIARILSDHVLLPRPVGLGEVEEDGETLVDNARLKARAVVGFSRLPAVADDTGLEVHALDGAPGVHSARFAGPQATYADNVSHLLAALAGVSDRRARFSTVALVAFPDGSEVSATGCVEGFIAIAGRGDNGFGYDPVFVPDEGGGLTFAEMSIEAKNALSHRGRAFRALAQGLSDLSGQGWGAGPGTSPAP
ncbi:MAG: RdgB/HAM1 family non-canonical purine NTP pyrophosphatase [Acidimicrobiales bacterium]